MVHFKEVLDTHLPLITDTQYSENLKEDLDQMAYDFRSKIKKFLRNKEKSKVRYKTGKKYNFLLHELVMRKVYNPPSLLHPVFTGPYRIMEIFELGALLKDPRTGDTCSVHFQNLRKLTVDEFATLLPANFDHDVIKHLSLSRYNRAGTAEKIQLSQYKPEGHLQQTETVQQTDMEGMTLRSGKSIKLNVTQLTKLQGQVVQAASFTPGSIPWFSSAKTTTPILRHTLRPIPTPYATIEQQLQNGIWTFHSSLHAEKIRDSSCYKKRFKSSFQSPEPGTLMIDLEQSVNSRVKKVQFSKLIVHFY